jgi:sugar phosphate isomerase/epimerase
VLSTASFFPDTRTAFRMAADCGYDGVEVMVNYDRNSQSVGSVQGLARQYGVPVTAVHVPCLVVSQHVWGFSPEVKLRRSVDMATAVGADVVVVHPPFRWQRGVSESFAATVTELDGAGARVTVENMYGMEALGRRVQPWVWSDAESLLRFPGLTLDTSHAGANRADVLELYELTRGRVMHLHLSDSTSTRGDEHLPPGAGTLALEELAGAMVADGFDGQVVVEVGIGRLPVAARAAATSDCATWARAAFGR